MDSIYQSPIKFISLLWEYKSTNMHVMIAIILISQKNKTFYYISPISSLEKQKFDINCMYVNTIVCIVYILHQIWIYFVKHIMCFLFSLCSFESNALQTNSSYTYYHHLKDLFFPLSFTSMWFCQPPVLWIVATNAIMLWINQSRISRDAGLV